MPLTTLKINDFRNLTSFELQPCSGLNIICGSNGSGKTSLLEAIHYLGMGKSFRSPTPSSLIKHTKDKFSIFAQLMTDQDRCLSFGVERHLEGSQRLRIAEKETASMAELAQFLPIRVINSQSHTLFESGPAFRRKYLDWGLFYQSAPFLSCWRQYERVLKQRNASLKNKRPKKEVDIWTEELIKHGLQFDELRRTYIQALSPLITDLANDLLGLANIELQYYSGWEQDYAAAFAHAYGDEIRFGYTLFGPHRADLDILHQATSVKHFLSRGQQKLLICAMIVAQGMLLTAQANKGLIYLIDDLPSELDSPSREKLISLLSRQKTQIFITAIEYETIFNTINTNIPSKVFHVEHGNIRETL